MSSSISGPCGGSMCSFGAFSSKLGCESGDGSCWTAFMAEADNTTLFHDQELYDATTEIQRILNGITKPTDGRTLSFVHTEEGTILAWVQHGVPFPGNAVKFKHGHTKVKAALKIKGPKVI